MERTLMLVLVLKVNGWGGEKKSESFHWDREGKKRWIFSAFLFFSDHPLTSRKGYAVAGSSAETNARLVLARSCYSLREKKERSRLREGSGKEGAPSSRRERQEKTTASFSPLAQSLSFSSSLCGLSALRKPRTWLGQLTMVSWKACGAAIVVKRIDGRWAQRRRRTNATQVFFFTWRSLSLFLSVRPRRALVTRRVEITR
jgi:hypothetical protein